MLRKLLLSCAAFFLLANIHAADTASRIIRVGATEIEVVRVSQPNNPADLSSHANRQGRGSVPYPFEISKSEITNRQLLDFLNATVNARAEILSHWANQDSPPAETLYPEQPEAATIYGWDSYGPIVPDPAGDSYILRDTLPAGAVERPANFVNYPLAIMYCNWLHNGAPANCSSKELLNGSYDIQNGFSAGSLKRSSDATWVLPTENEWYKAAFYDSKKDLFWSFATGSDDAPAPFGPGRTEGNCNYSQDYSLEDSLVPVTDPRLGASPSGTINQSGGLWEWLEEMETAEDGTIVARIRGGTFFNDADYISAEALGFHPISQADVGGGFRVVRLRGL